jgi:hypothetical protein
MILIEIKGGLGNQMFQYAAAYSLAQVKKTKVGYCPEFNSNGNHQNYTNRIFQLSEIFDLQNGVQVQPEKLLKVRRNPTTLLDRLVQKLKGESRFIEPSLEYHSDFFDVSSNAYLEGYFQSEKYFATIRKDILKLFHFDQNKLNFKSSEILSKMLIVNAVAVHIRRGDFMQNQAVNALHGVCEPSYYTAAMKHYSGLLGVQYFVFSDDIDWVRNNILFNDETVFINWNHGTDSWQDMFLMSQCKNFIIANSSFSWWGAWLSTRDDKKVIAPSRWFANNTKNDQTKDLIPPSWIRI